ncbi:MAG: S1 family peptidase [Deltaproteobacteria bacterium]|nr:S1 family peptidase [Deltaproteobacteria bacterium]
MAFARGEGLVGGEPVADGSPLARQTVALGWRGDAFCSATIVAEDLVVTAAHCVRNSHDIEVLFETDTVSEKNPRRRPIVGYELAPGYDPDDEHPERRDPPPRNRADFALVRFTGGLPAGFNPAQLVPADHVFHDADEIELAGYGGTFDHTTPNDPVGILRAGHARLRDARFSPTELQIDASEESSSHNAGGDSGGPALVRIGGEPYLFGVCNWGRVGEFTVFALVRPRLAWMSEAAKRLRQHHGHADCSTVLR